jgi:hypothetical protein
MDNGFGLVYVSSIFVTVNTWKHVPKVLLLVFNVLYKLYDYNMIKINGMSGDSMIANKMV